METVVDIKKVSVVLGGKHFQALKDVTVQLPKGRIVGVIGPSGAGKTTLIRSIVGRQKVSSGSITIFDLPAGNKQLRHEVSYMTQETSVYADLSVTENLEYFATMIGIPRKSMRAEVAGIIETIDLATQSKQLVGSLSGGQKQRVSLGIALLGDPKLLVLDEPTVGLDPALREQLWNLFHKLADSGHTLIISSHVMDEAERCHKLLLIRDGQLLAQGSPDELNRQTGSHSVEQSFLKLIGETR